ncbi:MAG: ribosomal protein S18 acetylase RimI-like enzyme [Cryomorphaceae bacterium]|jgi:ribosomal protein S18 acetylase RimI-like enzyme
MKTRAFNTRDTEPVVALWQRCEIVTATNNPRLDIARKQKVNPELFLLGEIGQELVASVMGGYEGHRGWVNYLAVEPDHRGQGFGLAMMNAIEHELRQLGCPKINLQVRAKNSSAIEFYRSIGYLNDEVVSFGKRLD